ncbi:MAG: inorganic phosphate transporter [Euryarchaeota archaeon]|nr:inorganic phosphate transporter [Euryarchaeota archaeon]
MDILFLAILTFILALFFTFTNGVHDASATASTMVACGATSPRRAVFFVSLLGFLGAILGGSAVALTLQTLIVVETGPLLVKIIFAAVTGATAWNVVTWRSGLPSSSTHSILGGLVGATSAGAGLGSVAWGLEELAMGELAGLTKVVVFLILSVIVGFVGGYLVRKISAVLLRGANRAVNNSLRRAQWFTTGTLAFAHGANDTQKQMGLIVLVLLSVGVTYTMDIPSWVRFSCAVVMAMGMLRGGWRIMRTLGRDIYPLKPLDSLDSQLVSSSSILLSTIIGAPVSTTQVISSSVLGVGAGENVRMVHWGVGKHMVISWFLTIPASAFLSALIFIILEGASGLGVF